MPEQYDVLVVDDSPFFPFLIEETLEGSEFSVIAVVPDGSEAIGILQDARPDIVLLDILMPKLDGLEFLRRARVDYLPTKFLMVSAITDRKRVLACKNAGADGFLSKESVVDQLLETLRKLMRTSQPESVPPERV